MLSGGQIVLQNTSPQQTDGTAARRKPGPVAGLRTAFARAQARHRTGRPPPFSAGKPAENGGGREDANKAKQAAPSRRTLGYGERLYTRPLKKATMKSGPAARAAPTPPRVPAAAFLPRRPICKRSFCAKNRPRENDVCILPRPMSGISAHSAARLSLLSGRTIVQNI